MKSTKAFTVYSTNPKMGKAYPSVGKGYADGGKVPEEDTMTSRMQVSGGGVSVKDGIAGGGRVGYTTDVGKDASVTIGVSGSGVRTKDYKDAKLTGADVTYRKGDTSVGVEVQKGRYTPDPMGGPNSSFDPSDRRVMFKYRKEF
jgi:hypothetical protein